MPTTESVWHAVNRASFAVLSHVTPSGRPRSSGVVYTVEDGRLYTVVGADSWKAKHIPLHGRVAVTVPIRRGGLLALLFPIPPATVSFQADAIVHPAGPLGALPVPERLSSLLPPDAQRVSRVIELQPVGDFVTYGIGVSLRQMRTPALARGRAPVK
ncbi:pyridoxamine 5'-phosphate oxidase family protein [Cryptosporangium minutisporangium]